MKKPQKGNVAHERTRELLPAVRYLNPLSCGSMRAHLSWSRRQPRQYSSNMLRALTMAFRHRKHWLGIVYSALCAPMAASEAQRTGVEHMHAHWATYPALTAEYVAKLCGVGSSFTAHAHDIFANGFALQQKAASVDAIITISEFNAQYIGARIDSADRKKIHIIPSGVETCLTTPLSRHCLFEKSEITLTCVGTLEDKKGQSYLIAALRDVSLAHPEVRLRLVGDGPDRQLIESCIAQYGLQSIVTLRGWCTQSEVRQELERSDIFVLPSVVAKDGRMEGIPVALMEAMSAGVPVITSNISGIPELVRHEETGLLVPERDSQALGASISRLIEDTELYRRLSYAGQQEVIHRYDLKVNVSRLSALFAEIIGVQREGRPRTDGGSPANLFSGPSSSE